MPLLLKVMQDGLNPHLKMNYVVVICNSISVETVSK